MKKFIVDFRVEECELLADGFARLRLSPADGSPLPAMQPGQFAQIAVDNSKNTFLRRPISINDVDPQRNVLTLLVRRAGDGTARLVASKPGDIINILLPLGNGFSKPDETQQRLLLVGGGVGVAPLLYLGKCLKAQGKQPEFLLGARSASLLLLLDDFKAIGPVHIATDDGSEGHCGVVTTHPRMSQATDRIYCCGPAPMMKAVAAKAAAAGIDCEVSLENMMACGLGACLCCVENTVKGNVCVCTEGPVFNIKQLTWQS